MLVSTEDPHAAEALEQELGGPVYTRSTGERIALDSMATPHLRSAHAKLARDWPGHPEIAPMADEIARRDAEYQAEQAALAEGVQS